MPGFQVDGNDLFAVYQMTLDAVERARSGGGPTLIEAVTYRIGPHTTADDPGRYRSSEEGAEWAGGIPSSDCACTCRKGRHGPIPGRSKWRVRPQQRSIGIGLAEQMWLFGRRDL